MTDYYDACTLASEQFAWIETLVHQARTTDGSQAETLLNIAEFLAETWANDFHKMALKEQERMQNEALAVDMLDKWETATHG